MELFGTLKTDLRKAMKSNSLTADFPNKINTITEPVRDGVHDVGYLAGVGENKIKVFPYAVAGNNDTYSMRIIAWNKTRGIPGTTDDLWVHSILCEVACQSSDDGGMAGTAILDTERFADTITLVANMGTQGTNADVFSPQNDTKAHVVVDLKGAQLVEFLFDSTAAGTLSMNALFQPY